MYNIKLANSKKCMITEIEILYEMIFKIYKIYKIQFKDNFEQQLLSSCLRYPRGLILLVSLYLYYCFKVMPSFARTKVLVKKTLHSV